MGLNPFKSAGSDNIHPTVLKKAADYLVVPLTSIFCHSFEIGALPLDWKSAYVVPIYSGSQQCSRKYRTISLTSNVIKIFESTVKDFIFSHLKLSEVVSNMQHAFIPKGLFKSQLLNILNKINEPRVVTALMLYA